MSGEPGVSTVFDLKLFLQLNEEYKDKPVQRTAPLYDDESRASRARQLAARIEVLIGIRGKRVLEVGCGHGDLSACLARDYGCEVVGVDIVRRPTWDQHRHPRLSLQVLDLSQGHSLKAGSFERIVSLVVWEHVLHPFALLKACRDLLGDEGIFFLQANLFASPVASHLYREVFFPWPHLLFPDEVFEHFYRHQGLPPNRPAWVNKLTYAHYRLYFDLLGFDVEWERLDHHPLDEAFYKRFEDVLSRYPTFDLTHDYFWAVLAPRRTAGKPHFPRNSLAWARSSRLARRLALRPRGLNYWSTLPADLVRIACRL